MDVAGCPRRRILWPLLFVYTLLSTKAGLACPAGSFPAGGACACQAEGVLLCQNLDSSSGLARPAGGLTGVADLRITGSGLKCIDPGHLAAFEGLRRLSVSGSRLERLLCRQPPGRNSSQQQLLGVLTGLEQLSLAGNRLASLSSNDRLDRLTRLEFFNASGNSIARISPRLFANMKRLEVLDLSANNLDERLKPSVLKTLPKSLKYLDLSNNTWACSAHMAWIHRWRAGLEDESVVKKPGLTRCYHGDDMRHSSGLFLVMQYYDETVSPHCPVNDGCSCLIHSIQETMVTSSKRHYTVHVSCANQNLAHFPRLPEHTQTVDLSNNKLNNDAFSMLDVKLDNYNEVENLTVDGNVFETLPEKLLDMNLGLRFSAKNNSLTSISYDVSQKLIQTTDVIELSNNPWKCTCSSQITDLNLIAKVADRKYMKCGPGSDLELEDKRIDGLDPQVLCPPSSKGASQEVLLQMLCVLLAILIVLILSKLAYDFRVYRTRGQLPWLVLNMP